MVHLPRGYMSRLVGPFDTGVDDRSVVRIAVRESASLSSGTSLLQRLTMRVASSVLIRLPALLAWPMNYCLFVVGIAIRKLSL